MHFTSCFVSVTHMYCGSILPVLRPYLLFVSDSFQSLGIVQLVHRFLEAVAEVTQCTVKVRPYSCVMAWKHTMAYIYDLRYSPVYSSLPIYAHCPCLQGWCIPMTYRVLQNDTHFCFWGCLPAQVVVVRTFQSTFLESQSTRDHCAASLVTKCIEA